MKKQYDIAAFIWPAYTGDEPRSRIFWPGGIGEWETVQNDSRGAKPLWGYVNEADPYVMEMQIEAAVDHGVNVFIYDWYWYDKRPFLQNCLDDGFLKAKNNKKMKFYLMWANHDANYLWDKRNSDTQDEVIWRADVDLNEFKKIGKLWLEKYFVLDNYYKIDNKPVLNIHYMPGFIKYMGSVENATEAMRWLNEEAKKYGFDGVHFQNNERDRYVVDVAGTNDVEPVKTNDLLEVMGFESITNYQYAHMTNVDRDYDDVTADAVKKWYENQEKFNISYFPHVSIGWNNEIRHVNKKGVTTTGRSPEKFEKALRLAKEFTDKYNKVPLITINSWNEWTEESYLQPDTQFGYGYLEAVKKVFVDE